MNDAQRQTGSSIPVLIAGGAALAGVGLSACTGIYMLAFELESDDLLRLTFVGAIIAVFSLAASGCLLIIRRNMFRPLMWLGIVAAVCGMITWSYFTGVVDGHVWYGPEVTMLRLGGTFAVSTLAITLFGQVMSMRTSSGTLAGLRLLFIGLFVLLSLLSIILMWWGDYLERALPNAMFMTFTVGFGVAVPVCLVGLSLVPALIRRDNRRRGMPRESLDRRVAMAALCPQCDAEQMYVTGLNRCKACGFMMMVEFEEPRCECGYLLYRLVGTVCPECGREVTATQRWADRPSTPDMEHSSQAPISALSEEGKTE